MGGVIVAVVVVVVVTVVFIFVWYKFRKPSTDGSEESVLKDDHTMKEQAFNYPDSVVTEMPRSEKALSVMEVTTVDELSHDKNSPANFV